MSYIYSLTHPITGEIRYIGKTCNCDTRLRDHINEAKYNKGNTPKINWIKSLLKRGMVPKLVILEEVDDVFVNDREKYYISEERKINPKLTNLMDGGEGISVGYKFSDSAKLNMSNARKSSTKSVEFLKNLNLAQKGINNPFYGKRHTEETKKLQSMKHTGLLSGSKHPLYGVGHSEESKTKISDTRKQLGCAVGDKNPKARAVSIFSKNGEFVADFSCIKFAQEFLNVPKYRIIKNLETNGRLPKNFNYLIKYKEMK